MKKSITYGGPSTLTILGIIFIVLKLTNLISWSWVWVLAPFWVPVVLALFGILIYFLIFVFILKK